MKTRRLRNAGRIAALTVALSGAVPIPALAQDTQQLSANQMRVAAAQAVTSDRPDITLRLTGALLERDPGDIEALLLQSRAARDLGRYPEARSAARAAWQLSEDNRRRYAAALAMAQALASDGKRMRAQFWLRRAVQVAPTPRAEAQAIRDFRYVQARNPWRLQATLNIAPNSNINGGSTSETVTIYDLPFQFALEGTSRALSGVEYAAGLSASYTLAEAARARTRLNLSGFHKTYTLSSDARDIAPDAEGSDFALTQVSAGLAQDWLSEDRRASLALDLGLTRSWYGGDLLSQSLRAGARVSYAVTPAAGISASVSQDWQEGFGTREDAIARLGALRWSQRVGPALRGSAGLSRLVSRSDAVYLDYDETRLDLGLRLARPVLGTDLSLGLWAAERHYDATTVSFGDRTDQRRGATVTAVLDRVDYLGFVPSFTLSHQVTRSDVDLFDSEETGISVGIRSRF